MAALFTTFIGYGMIQPLLSLHTSGFVGTSYLLVGVLISMIGLVKAGFGPVSGFLSDVHGRKKLATIGAGALAGSLAIVYLSTSTVMLVVGFLLFGVGQAMFFLAMMTAMVEAAGPEKRAIAMGLYEGVQWHRHHGRVSHFEPPRQHDRGHCGLRRRRRLFCHLSPRLRLRHKGDVSTEWSEGVHA